MYFCPFCGSLLLLDKPDLFRFSCPTCEYVVPVTETLTLSESFVVFNKKRDFGDDFTSLSDSDQSTHAEGSQVTNARCESRADPPCDSEKAWFIQVQMRSADEPPTTFFRCCKCKFQWRSD
jgi:DNA-directed RNA polymerase III subunit RPC11